MKLKIATKEFYKSLKSWITQQWRNVIYSDEISLEVDDRKCGFRLRRMLHEKYNPDCIIKTTKQVSSSIGIWACMRFNGLGVILIFNGRLNAIR